MYRLFGNKSSIAHITLQAPIKVRRTMVIDGVERTGLVDATVGRIIFNGENTQKPVISEMILACRVPVNVLFADTKSVEGAAYGHMIFELPNDEHDAEKVISWLKNSGLTWKEER